MSTSLSEQLKPELSGLIGKTEAMLTRALASAELPPPVRWHIQRALSNLTLLHTSDVQGDSTVSLSKWQACQGKIPIVALAPGQNISFGSNLERPHARQKQALREFRLGSEGTDLVPDELPVAASSPAHIDRLAMATIYPSEFLRSPQAGHYRGFELLGYPIIAVNAESEALNNAAGLVHELVHLEQALSTPVRQTYEVAQLPDSPERVNAAREAEIEHWTTISEAGAYALQCLLRLNNGKKMCQSHVPFLQHSLNVRDVVTPKRKGGGIPRVWQLDELAKSLTG